MLVHGCVKRFFLLPAVDDGEVPSPSLICPVLPEVTQDDQHVKCWDSGAQDEQPDEEGYYTFTVSICCCLMLLQRT